MRTRFFCILIATLLMGYLGAQEFRATVTGHVLDSSGSAVPQAAIQARNIDNNEVTTATSDAQGVFTIPFCVPATTP